MAVVGWGGIDLVALFELTIEIFHVLRSWVVVENVMRQSFLTELIFGESEGLLTFGIKFGTFSLYHVWLALAA